MVKLNTIASFFLLALPAVWASPTPEIEARHDNDCISTQDANNLLKQFITLSEKLDENVAKRILTQDYTVYSASLNFLFGINGGPTSVGRDQFIEGTKKNEKNNPPGQKIIILDADHTCSKIYFRWKTNAQPETTALFGFDELILVRKGGSWKVKIDYSEFNNAILLYNAGLFPCNASNTPTPGT